MFKKDQQIVEKSRCYLKNKEIRLFRQSLLQQYHPHLTEDELNKTFFPSSKVMVTLIKLVDRHQLYEIDHQLAFFLIDSGHPNIPNKIYPTISTLQRLPSLLPILTCHPPVSRYILRGADFMVPGLVNLQQVYTLQQGQPCALCIRGNPIPFAVGDCLLSGEVLAASSSVNCAMHERKGKAMTIHHVYGDLLCGGRSGSGSSMSPPNAGFTLQEIYPIIKPEEEEEDEESQEEEREDDVALADDQGGDNDVNDALEEGLIVVDNIEEETLSPSQEVAEEDDEDNENQQLVELPQPLEVEEQEEEQEQAEKAGFTTTTTTANHPPAAATIPSKEILDGWLERALALALRYIIKEDQLPILVSKFWSILLRCHTACMKQLEEDITCNDGSTNSGSGSNAMLDIRHSSYRKVQTFLDHWARKGLLGLDKDNTNSSSSSSQQGSGSGSGGMVSVDQIRSIHRQHELCRHYKVKDVDAFKLYVNNQSSGDSQQHQQQSLPSSKGGGSASTTTTTTGVVILELYKPPKKMREVFGMMEGELGQYLRASEMKDLVLKFVQGHGLEIEGERNKIKLHRDGDTAGLFELLFPHIPKESTNLINSNSGSSGSGSNSKEGGGQSSLIGSSSKQVDPTSRHVKGEQHQETVERSEDDDEELDNDDFSNSLNNSNNPSMAMPLSLPQAPEYKMRIAKEGLINLNTLSLSSSSSTTAAALPLPPRSSTTTTTTATSTTWKPVSLPSKSAQTSQRKSSSTLSSSSQPVGLSSVKVEKKNKSSNPSTASGQPLEVIVTKEVFVKACLASAVRYHALQSHGETSIHSGTPPKIEILGERRNGNKMVTMIRGADHFSIDLADLSKKLQKRFACSVSVGHVAGIAKQAELLLQGEFLMEVENYLVDHLHIPRHLIDVKKPKGGKGKKK